MFKDIYKNKKVLITGNTGFKGSWLSIWLKRLGAEVIGVSSDIPTNPSNFVDLDIEKDSKHFFLDICNTDELKKIINDNRPDFIFHLAAQAIVSTSYSEPLNTIRANVLGTASLMECLKEIDWDCVSVIITSDKCYDNIEQLEGYVESDTLGGKDIYSGSKGAAELVIKSYFHSFLEQKNNIKIGIGRAGNVIGGGDWAKDRIVVDCMKAWINNDSVQIRCPDATRPWQHVLEPLSGYLSLGHNLFQDNSLNGESFNFGPNFQAEKSVKVLIEDLASNWGFSNPKEAYNVINKIPFHEASLLKLDCTKAKNLLLWSQNLNYEQTIKLISDWYLTYRDSKQNLKEKTYDQIKFYEKNAREILLPWAQS